MTLRVLAFAEDVLGLTLARDLCDRVVTERGPDWLSDLWRDPTLLATQRTWSGFDPAHAWTKWAATKDLAERQGVRVHGLGVSGYSLFAYRAARLAAKLQPPPDAVVLCLDTDGHEGVREAMMDGLRRARVEGLPFAVAVAHQESEAWVMAGFLPENRAEEATLRALEAEHGFDPTAEPHRLTAGRPTAPHDAKRVSGSLFPDGTSSPRAARCWLDTPLDVLEQRGGRTGLPDYLGDVMRVLWPLLGAQRVEPGGG